MKSPRRGTCWEPPDKEWLEHQFVILEKSVNIIAKEVGAHNNTVKTWLLKVGIDPVRRYHRRKSPSKKWLKNEYLELEKSILQIAEENQAYWSLVEKWLKEAGIELRNRYRIDPPGEEWLRDQYLVQEKSMRQIGQGLQVSSSVVGRWLDEAGIARRTQDEQTRLRLAGAFGSAHPAWRGGCRDTFSKRANEAMEAAEVLKVCTGPGPHEGELVIHHIDEDMQNNNLENLQYLCRACHAGEHYHRRYNA